MDNKNRDVLGGDSYLWGCASIAMGIFAVAGVYGIYNPPSNPPTKTYIAGAICILGFFFTLGMWILASIRGRQVDAYERRQTKWRDEEDRDQKREWEKHERRLQAAASQLPPPPNPAPDPYLQTEAELEARRDHAQKVQRLHEMRKQVEEEERKAGIFAPTLSPSASTSAPAPPASAHAIVPAPPEKETPSRGFLQRNRALDTASQNPHSSDPLVDEMRKLAQRQQEAERQKHLQQSRRVVEEAEREADGL